MRALGALLGLLLLAAVVSAVIKILSYILIGGAIAAAIFGLVWLCNYLWPSPARRPAPLIPVPPRQPNPFDLASSKGSFATDRRAKALAHSPYLAPVRPQATRRDPEYVSPMRLARDRAAQEALERRLADYRDPGRLR